MLPLHALSGASLPPYVPLASFPPYAFSSQPYLHANQGADMALNARGQLLPQIC